MICKKPPSVKSKDPVCAHSRSVITIDDPVARNRSVMSASSVFRVKSSLSELEYATEKYSFPSFNDPSLSRPKSHCIVASYFEVSIGNVDFVIVSFVDPVLNPALNFAGSK